MVSSQFLSFRKCVSPLVILAEQSVRFFNIPTQVNGQIMDKSKKCILPLLHADIIMKIEPVFPT